MAAGRKPKPAEAKEAAGNPGKRRIAKTPDSLPSASLPAPKFLSKQAKIVWDRAAPGLIKINFLRATDIDAFARYCEHVAEFWMLTRRLRRDGLTYWTDSNHGKLKRLNPDFQARDRIERQLVPLEDRFGLSTAARQQIMQRLADRIPMDPGMQNRAENQGDMLSAQSGQDEDTPVGFLN